MRGSRGPVDARSRFGGAGDQYDKRGIINDTNIDPIISSDWIGFGGDSGRAFLFSSLRGIQ